MQSNVAMQVLGSIPVFWNIFFFYNVCLPAWVFPQQFSLQFSPADLKKKKNKTA